MSVKPENGLEMNTATAAELGVQTGDMVKISNQSGDTMQAKATVINGIRPGYVVISHGWGHTEMGAKDIAIDGHEGGGIKGDPRISGGFTYNEVCAADPAQSGDLDTIGCPTDPIGCGNETYGYAVKLEKV